ncbi:MAG: DNA topoisomerase IB [Pseudolabrys sp.]|nr:DNA topoisomerase IB [Pseudolabrys sp.]
MTKASSATSRLIHVEATELKLRRRRSGDGFTFLKARGGVIRDKTTIARLRRLAVPPAYEHVRYAENPLAHIQAIGQDAAGRRQYRYHAQWDEVRERRKAGHLAELIRLLPKLRAAISRHLSTNEPTRDFALAAVIDLIAATAIRAGSEAYAREHGTRGAATLLKTDVTIKGDQVALHFRGKGGKDIEKTFRSARLARSLRKLKQLPGKRLFQYRNADGVIAKVRRRDVNSFLQEITSDQVTLKDFRTLIACGCALAELSALDPKPSERGRRKQVVEALRSVAEELANTPAVCRKSYVHTAIVGAFESGDLAKMTRNTSLRSASARERLLSQMLRRLSN